MSQRRVWRGAGIALGLAIASGGCQDGYPIPATRCDVWCETSRKLDCGGYDPAACVVACENQGISNEVCSEPYEAALSCLRNTPNNQFDCNDFSNTPPCFSLQQELLTCGYTNSQGFGAPQ